MGTQYQKESSCTHRKPIISQLQWYDIPEVEELPQFVQPHRVCLVGSALMMSLGPYPYPEWECYQVTFAPSGRQSVSHSLAMCRQHWLGLTSSQHRHPQRSRSPLATTLRVDLVTVKPQPILVGSWTERAIVSEAASSLIPGSRA